MPEIFDIKITDNSQQVLSAFEQQLKAGMIAVGMTAEGYAKRNCPVDTGRLRASISHVEDMGAQVILIGTNVEYAPYIEFGTGIYADGYLGRSSPWMVVPDGSGKYKTPFWTHGNKPTHFLRNAVSDHKNEYKNIMEAALEK